MFTKYVPLQEEIFLTQALSAKSRPYLQNGNELERIEGLKRFLPYATSLSSHLIPLIDIQVDKDQKSVDFQTLNLKVMRLVEKESSDENASMKLIPEFGTEAFLVFVFGVFDALDTLHRLSYAENQSEEKCGYIHRDVSLENIFITENGSCLLGDYELCLQIGKTGSGNIGRMAYAPPEQHKEVCIGDVKTDIYQLAICVLDLILLKSCPDYKSRRNLRDIDFTNDFDYSVHDFVDYFELNSDVKVEERIPSLKSLWLNLGLPERVFSALQRASAFNQIDRFDSIKSFWVNFMSEYCDTFGITESKLILSVDKINHGVG